MAKKDVELFDFSLTIEAPDEVDWKIVPSGSMRALSVEGFSNYLCAFVQDAEEDCLRAQIFPFPTFSNGQPIPQYGTLWLRNDPVCQIQWDLNPEHEPTLSFSFSSTEPHFEGVGKAKVAYAEVEVDWGEMDLASMLFQKLGFREDKAKRIESSDEQNIAAVRFFKKANSAGIKLVEELFLESVGSDAIGITVEEPLAVAEAMREFIATFGYQSELWEDTDKVTVSIRFLSQNLELIKTS